jgi:molecular chaperone DnaJ
MKDFYAILGVQRNASKDEIVKAYRKGAQQHHPDRNPGDAEAETRFKEIQEAYDTLSDPNKRAEYDMGGQTMQFRTRNGFQGNPFSAFGDMGDFFSNSSYKGRSLTIKQEIELEEAYSGCTKDISIKIKNTCVTCKGLGQVSKEDCANCNGQGFVKTYNAPFEFRANCNVCNGLGKINPIPCTDCNSTGFLSGYKEKKIKVEIPCGVDNGMNIRLSGQGEESIRGGRAGDLIIHILVRDHAIFNREGIDLFVDVPMSYSQMVLGCDIDVPTIGKEVVTIKIPEGTQTHTKFKVRGKGLQLPNGILGDMFVTVKLEIPKNLSSDYKESVKKLMVHEMSNIGHKREQWIKNIKQKDR